VNYWLLKSEPQCFSLDDLKARPRQTEHWDGVRNYQARNFLRDRFAKGDLGFFYHSSCAEPAIAGIVEIVRSGYPDHTAWDPKAEHFDPKSSPDTPIWYMVDVKWKQQFGQPIRLAELRANPVLQTMELLKRGSRLSVMPVTTQEWREILKMGKTVEFD